MKENNETNVKTEKPASRRKTESPDSQEKTESSPSKRAEEQPRYTEQKGVWVYEGVFYR